VAAAAAADEVQEASVSGSRSPLSYRVFDLVRLKRGKAAEVALAAGEPSSYVLRYVYLKWMVWNR
jgi:hypothetical protein